MWVVSFVFLHELECDILFVCPPRDVPRVQNAHCKRRARLSIFKQEALQERRREHLTLACGPAHDIAILLRTTDQIRQHLHDHHPEGTAVSATQPILPVRGCQCVCAGGSVSVLGSDQSPARTSRIGPYGTYLYT